MTQHANLTCIFYGSVTGQTSLTAPTPPPSSFLCFLLDTDTGQVTQSWHVKWSGEENTSRAHFASFEI